MPRLVFVQWLRVFLIALVVAHHAGQAYGPTGGAWPIHDEPTQAWLGPFFGVNAAFFMGFFFFIAGYFSPSSFDRKGAARFIRDRLVRLGVPLAVITLFVFGPLVYLAKRPDTDFLSFFFLNYVGRLQFEFGPLWFIAQLLVYDLLYALFRLGVTPWGGSGRFAPGPPGNVAILAYALCLALAGALVRLAYPQDEWVRILGLIPAEPAHMPQYVSLFVLGLVAGRGRWFERVPSSVGLPWFLAGVTAFLGFGVLLAYRADLPPGFDLGSAWGFAEGFICVGMILGLTVLFRRAFNRPGAWLAFLEAQVYGVYLLHFFVVVPLQFAVHDLPLSTGLKFAVVTAAALVISFSGVAALRQLPWMNRVI